MFIDVDRPKSGRNARRESPPDRRIGDAVYQRHPAEAGCYVRPSGSRKDPRILYCDAHLPVWSGWRVSVRPG